MDRIERIWRSHEGRMQTSFYVAVLGGSTVYFPWSPGIIVGK